jgi:hypothetical protein
MIVRVAARLIAALFALMAVGFPGFGAIDLSVSWSTDWNPVLAGGWGLFFTVVIGAPFLVVAAVPHYAAPAVWALWLALSALAVSAVVSLEGPLALFLGWLLLGAACVALSPVVEPWRALHVDIRRSRILAVALLSSPWLAYSWRMAANNREGRADTDITVGVDHYSVQAALGLALVLLALLAACWPRGRRQLTTYAGVCAFYLGVLSLGWSGFPGAMATGWAVGAIAWGLGLTGWAWLNSRPRTAFSADAPGP